MFLFRRHLLFVDSLNLRNLMIKYAVEDGNSQSIKVTVSMS